MANTFQDYTATADQTDFAFTFDYLEDEHVTVEINGVVQLTSAYSIIVESNGDTKVRLNVGATAGQIVRVRRKSQPDTNLVDFVNGSVLTESELDRAYLHNRYLAEEIAELNDASLQLEQGGTQWDAKSLRIKNVDAPTATGDATNKTYVDNKVNQVSNGTPYPPTKWVFTGNSGANTTYTVTGAEVNGDTAYDLSIDGVVKEPTTDYTVDPDTDTLTIIPSLNSGERIVVIQRGFGVAITSTVVANIIDGAVSTSKLADGAVTTNKLGNSAVTTAKINDGAVTPVKTNFDQLNIEAATTSEGQSGYATIEMGGASGAFIDLKRPFSDDYDARILSADTSLDIHGIYGTKINTGATGTTAVYVHTDNKVKIGDASTPAYALDVAGDVNVTGNFKVNGTNLTTGVPTGTVSAFAGSAAPTGYLMCDGSEHSQTTETALFAVISTTYNTGGETANHFRVPDLRGRVVAGQDDMGGTSANRLTNQSGGLNGDTLGATGGAETHLLTAAQSGLPSHNHTSGVQSSNNNYATGSGNGTVQGAGIDTGYTGGTDASAAHNNVQPTIILNYIIKK